MKKEPNIVYLVGKIVQTDIGVVSACRLTTIQPKGIGEYVSDQYF